MELAAFLPLLAFLPILFPWAAPSEAPPPAPSISVSPAKARFLIGDSVSIACAAPEPPGADRIQSFRFTRAGGSVTDVWSSKRSAVRTFNVTGVQDGGAQSCAYTVLRRGESVTSEPSAAVIVHVQDRPSQPNLTVTPSPLTVEGQPLILDCTAPPGTARRRFGFFQDELEFVAGVVEGSGSGARLRVESSGRNQSGNFSCRYWEWTEGRWIQSRPSGAVPVLVTGRCPAPSLSVEPPSAVVGAGHRLLLRCAAPRRHFRRRFRFFRDGDVIADVMEGAGNGSELLLPNLAPEFSGNFSCRMEEEVGGAWLQAPPSRSVAVMVKAGFRLLPLVLGLSVGVASLLLALPLAAWFCRKRRGGSRWRGLSPGDDTGTLPMGDFEVAA